MTTTRRESVQILFLAIGSALGLVLLPIAAVEVYLDASGDWNERIVTESGRFEGTSGTVSGYVYLYVVGTIACLITLFFCILSLVRPRTRRRGDRAAIPQ